MGHVYPKEKACETPDKAIQATRRDPIAIRSNTALFSNTLFRLTEVRRQKSILDEKSAKSTQKTGPQIAFEVKIRQKSEGCQRLP
jgi:hypothetical protein